MDATSEKIGEQTGLLSFHFAGDGLLMFWLDAHSPKAQVERAGVGRTEIAAAASKLRTLFSPERINYRRPEYSSDMAWLVPLGEKLLLPLADKLKLCNSLIVAPHAELHALPLHLLAPPGAAPLGTTHSISYVANLSLYALLLNRKVMAAGEREIPSLCLACAAREDSEPVPGSFAMTPRSYAEKTNGLFLEGTKASWMAVREYADRAVDLYLSCHGLFDSHQPLDSSLLLSDGSELPSRVNPNSVRHRLSVRGILDRGIRSRLIVLDACLSGVQHFSQGDEPMGFPTALLISGAGAVVASNWVVEQNCARDFMLALLDHWSAQSTSLGEAMRHAYALTRSRYPHPFHWAAFSLFGNNQLLFS